ncbi:MAG: hypothetical protein M0Z46_19430 [Actinomycetota bacterium]|jgi:hypothetical protein|nr:hypothetical protein [Actinomycetota bacterium]
MHPDLLGALARDRDRELLHHGGPSQSTDACQPLLLAREALQEARARLGATLVDIGVHLMAVT